MCVCARGGVCNEVEQNLIILLCPHQITNVYFLIYGIQQNVSIWPYNSWLHYWVKKNVTCANLKINFLFFCYIIIKFFKKAFVITGHFY